MKQTTPTSNTANVLEFAVVQKSTGTALKIWSATGGTALHNYWMLYKTTLT